MRWLTFILLVSHSVRLVSVCIAITRHCILHKATKLQWLHPLDLCVAEGPADNRVAFVGVDILATVLHCKRESGEQWIHFQVCLHVLTGYLHNRSGI
jgi:hypothetical protein